MWKIIYMCVRKVYTLLLIFLYQQSALTVCTLCSTCCILNSNLQYLLHKAKHIILTADIKISALGYLPLCHLYIHIFIYLLLFLNIFRGSCTCCFLGRQLLVWYTFISNHIFMGYIKYFWISCVLCDAPWGFLSQCIIILIYTMRMEHFNYSLQWEINICIHLYCTPVSKYKNIIVWSQFETFSNSKLNRFI